MFSGLKEAKYISLSFEQIPFGWAQGRRVGLLQSGIFIGIAPFYDHTFSTLTETKLHFLASYFPWLDFQQNGMGKYINVSLLQLDLMWKWANKKLFFFPGVGGEDDDRPRQRGEKIEFPQ